MPAAPTSYGSSLIAALRGGVSDMGKASTVALMPNVAPQYNNSLMFNLPNRLKGNINPIQPFASLAAAPVPQPQQEEGTVEPDDNQYMDTMYGWQFLP